MKEFVISNIDAHMRWAFSSGGKEDEVPLFQLVRDRSSRPLKLLAGGSGQFNIEFGKQAFHKPEQSNPFCSERSQNGSALQNWNPAWTS